MSTLDDLAQERQRIAERLADAERAKLAEELAEPETAERVLSRFDQPRAKVGRRGGRARTAADAVPAKPWRGRRQRGARRGAALSKTGPALGDATLRAISANPQGASAEEVRAYLSREFGMQARPNHLGMALQRHRRAWRLELRDGRWCGRAAAG